MAAVQTLNKEHSSRTFLSILELSYHSLTSADTIVNDGGSLSSWSILNGRFKAVVEITQGLNHVTLSYNNEECAVVSLTYAPRTGRSFFVRPVYIRCVGDEVASFQVINYIVCIVKAHFI